MTTSHWYVQKMPRVLGPFPAGEMRYFIRVGRISPTDRVSTDGEIWEEVSGVPELIPDELLPPMPEIFRG